jgi:ATP-binding cassette subfamily A (ABC1) protein 3
MWLCVCDVAVCTPSHCGHTRAGKTTLLSVLLGLTRATSGRVNVLGRDGVDAVRARVGVCPQHDILFDKLTAREHLLLYAQLKEVRGDLVADVERMLVDVDLASVADDCVDTYRCVLVCWCVTHAKCVCDLTHVAREHTLVMDDSGGMKRRLSVAIALLGDPLCLVLDECTTGAQCVCARARVCAELVHVCGARKGVITHACAQAWTRCIDATCGS